MILAEVAASAALPGPYLERARGRASVAVWADRGVSRLREGYQSGSARLRFPRTADGAPLETVLLNTAGGVTGGDALSYAASVEDGARGLVTTQAAERIYRRASDEPARIETTLTVGAGASLDWLPQETILFDRSALSRSLIADVSPDGRLLAVESIALGRLAMGETVRSAILSDRWRIRRGGKLIFADGIQFDGDAAATMASGATGSGAAAFATLVLVAPDAESRLDSARGALGEATGEAGASAWNGMLVARFVAPTAQTLRSDLVRLIEALRGASMPRVWYC